MLNEFEIYLKKSKNVETEYIIFYLDWLKTALNEINKKFGEFITSGDKKKYFKKLSKKEDDWLVTQTKYSIKLYNSFLKENTHIREKYKKSLWTEILNDLRTSLKVKNINNVVEKKYVLWINKFSSYLEFKSPYKLTKKDLQLFVTHLFNDNTITEAQEKEAMNSVLYLYEKILNNKHINLKSIKPISLPTVLTKKEIALIIKNAKGDYKIMMSLIYGSGLKLSEALNLKIKDLDIFNGFLFINDKNGKVLRKVPFSKLLKVDLELYLEKVSDIYINDKNNDNTKLSLEEFWLFPSKTLTKNFKTKKSHREHIYTTSVQQAFKRSLKLSNIDKKASIQTLRHSYATHLLESGCDIKVIQKLLGHVNLQTTMIYRSLAQKDILKIVSPLDSF